MIDAIQRLPSGLTVEMQPWTAGDMMRFARSSAKARGLMVADILERCRVASNPLGLYGWEEGQPIDPKELLVGDRVALTLAMRVFSMMEAEFTFSYECERCKKTNAWTVDLRRFLLPALPNTEEGERLGVAGMIEGDQPAAIYKPLGDKPILLGTEGAEEHVFFVAWSEEQARRYAESIVESFECEDGTRIEWTHLTEKMARSIAAKGIDPKKEPDRLMREAIRAQIVGITSASGQKVLPRDFDGALENVLWRDHQRFADERNEKGCGVDLEVDVVCSNEECKHIQWLDLPTVEDPAFFGTSPTSARSRRRSRR